MPTRATPPPPPVGPERQWVLAHLADDETVIFYEPPSLDAAIIGLTCAQPGRSARCVGYDEMKLFEAFVADGMSPDDAEEWMEYNTLGAWLGETTPVVIAVRGETHG